ncbi:MAG TPA: zinc-dependent alcohol dehydrogenase [bacterium]|nr:zinc-dependent alcohol dehydrogenase [bacterium]
MKAVVFHGVGDIRLDEVREPKLQKDTDAIVRLTSSAICGTDLHIIRGTMGGMKPGTILGHEGVGIVEEVGKEVRNFRPGDRVVIPSTIACGYCSYCRAGYFAQCDEANPKGKHAGTAFFGGPASTGPIQGLQAEFARVPFAHVNLIRVPEGVSDDEAILVSDIFPTGYFGADLAEIEHGDTVAVFGCGPVGAFAIASAFLHGAGRVLAVDNIPARLDMARQLGAEVIDFNKEDPTKAILALTGDIGVDSAIDAVGVDAEPAEKGPASIESRKQKSEFAEEVKKVAPKQDHDWEPGHAPSQALRWAVKSLAKAGTLSVIGVYPETFSAFPFGEATMKNLRINGGNCHHRKYIPKLLSLIRNRSVDLGWILTNAEPLSSAVEAYEAFNRRQAGWIKVKLEPAA